MYHFLLKNPSVTLKCVTFLFDPQVQTPPLTSDPSAGRESGREDPTHRKAGTRHQVYRHVFCLLRLSGTGVLLFSYKRV